jgi:hypothetical protein
VVTHALHRGLRFAILVGAREGPRGQEGVLGGLGPSAALARRVGLARLDVTGARFVEGLGLGVAEVVDRGAPLGACGALDALERLVDVSRLGEHVRAAEPVLGRERVTELLERSFGVLRRSVHGDPARVVAVRRGVVVGELEPKLSRFELHGLGLFVRLDGPVAGEPGARRVARSLVRTRGREVGLRRTLREIPFGGHFVRPDLRHRRATHALYTRLEQRQLVFELPEERHGELPVVSLEGGARPCEPDDGGVSFVRGEASGVGLDVLPARAAHVVVEGLARGTGLGGVARGGVAGENVGVQARPRARGHGARGVRGVRVGLGRPRGLAARREGSGEPEHGERDGRPTHGTPRSSGGGARADLGADRSGPFRERPA